jgi:hypothetical protein
VASAQNPGEAFDDRYISHLARSWPPLDARDCRFLRGRIEQDDCGRQFAEVQNEVLALRERLLGPRSGPEVFARRG